MNQLEKLLADVTAFNADALEHRNHGLALVVRRAVIVMGARKLGLKAKVVSAWLARVKTSVTLPPVAQAPSPSPKEDDLLTIPAYARRTDAAE